jgi:hypothetical protein
MTEPGLELHSCHRLAAQGLCPVGELTHSFVAGPHARSTSACAAPLGGPRSPEGSAQ